MNGEKRDMLADPRHSINAVFTDGARQLQARGRIFVSNEPP